MRPNKAITIDGRNFLNTKETQDRLKDIERRDREEGGWSNRKYKNFYL